MSPRSRPIRPPNLSGSSPTLSPLQQKTVAVWVPGSTWWRWLILVVGLVVPQWIMYSPSLMGSKVLLPLDLLALPNHYLPPTSEYESQLPVHNSILSDQVLSLEFSRRFCTSEIRSGRLPLWCPNYFLGAPMTKWPKYSPFNVIYYLFPFPITLAWIHLVKCIVAGSGAYLFFSRVLKVSYWPAVLGAWCFPLTGFLILWQGYTMSYTVAWLPWLLLAVESTVNRPVGIGGIGLAVATCLTLITGQVDVGGLVLLATGIYAIWCLVDQWYQNRAWSAVHKASLALVGGWVLGFCLTAPYLLPLVEYSRTGERFEQREAGSEERPPTGWKALSQTVMPLVHGSHKKGNWYLIEGNRLESAAGAYAGLLSALLLAPLAWTRQGHWSRNIGWIVLLVVSMSWVLDLPGFVWMWRLPGFKMLSFNRFVFAASFAILSMAVVGLDTVWQKAVRFQWWFVVPVIVLLGLGIWSVNRAIQTPPEPLGSQLEKFIESGRTTSQFQTMNDVRTAQANFGTCQWMAAGLCLLAIAGWLSVSVKRWTGPALGVVLGGLVVLEPLWLGHDVNPQSERKIYYPPIPTLQKLADLEPGRVVGYHCLPARLAEANGLRDIRGYDGVDPSRFIDVMRLAMDKASPQVPYALTQWYLPKLGLDRGNVRMHPVMDLFNVRYVILRGKPASNAQAILSGDDYWILQNRRALARAFVPRRVEVFSDEKQRLQRLGSSTFDPRQVALLEQSVDIPESCRGSVRWEREWPGELILRAQMDTRGLLVLVDMWDPGWRAWVGDRAIPIYRVNHVLRGVVLEAGESLITLKYQPTSFRVGVWIFFGATAFLVAWVVRVRIRRRSTKKEEM